MLKILSVSLFSLETLKLKWVCFFCVRKKGEKNEGKKDEKKTLKLKIAVRKCRSQKIYQNHRKNWLYI